MMTRLRRLHNDEAGHSAPAVAMLLGVVAAVTLPWGVLGDIDWLTILGGVALGLAAISSTAATHREVDYNIFARLEMLEGKQDADGDD